jgi:prepilin-type N-terminal cleavage/methylation domain-containing protein
MHTHNHRRSPRPGFTLTELIVAMTIILVLATLAVAFLPRIGQQERSARGADLVQRWLLIAKQRALSDRAPTGVRLIINPSEPNVVRELVYIQQPDDYSKGRFVNGGAGQSTFSGADFTGGGLSLGADDEAPVQAGDYLEVYGGGPVTQITQVVDANTLRHGGTTPSGTAGTTNYRIIRQPRRLQGETPLKLPQDIAIDLTFSRFVPSREVRTSPTSTITFREILFSPSGGAVGKGTTTDKIILYVRDMTLDLDTQANPPVPTRGGPTLITVFTRTGFIAAQYVNPDPTLGGPYPAGSVEYLYFNTRDPRSSGL